MSDPTKAGLSGTTTVVVVTAAVAGVLTVQASFFLALYRKMTKVECLVRDQKTQLGELSKAVSRLEKSIANDSNPNNIDFESNGPTSSNHFENLTPNSHLRINSKLPLPDNIDGVESIEICVFDTKVLTFFDQFHPFLATGLHLVISNCNKFSGNFTAMQHILALYNGPILSIYIDTWDLLEFSTNFPQHWSKCQMLHVGGISFVRENSDGTKTEKVDWKGKEMPKMVDWDRMGLAKLVEWLTERREDGQPRLLSAHLVNNAKAFVDLVFQDFHASNQQAPFFVDLPLHNAVEFRHINVRTNEQLSLDKLNDYEALLTRCPLGVDQQQQEEMDEAYKLLDHYASTLAHPRNGEVRFCVHEIGNEFGNLDDVYRLDD